MDSTERICYTNAYLNKLEVQILEVGQDEVGSYVICDKTVFHPQGGGQPNDENYFEKDGQRYPIIKLVVSRNPAEEPYLVKHYYEGGGGFLKGEQVLQVIDTEKRLLFARYHSGGHLLSLAVNQLYPELDGYKGNHFPGQAFVVFERSVLKIPLDSNKILGGLPSDFSLLKEKVSGLVNELVKNNHLIQAGWKENSRTIHFVGFDKSYPCGGTYVKSVSEIGEIIIRNIKKDKGDLRIGYNVGE
ncbi:MAG: alanyl-tRNA editing protein [Candidatus Moeniiplasma glomeromycotorum]|nr:alanyl-tRNA editing protein [Candidatus Moeniiplasma glomeromycotorum]MCE8166031.1 alanyl-tRNA editing protein [Candidatus Moeniiplasma glomeromycotorum]